MAGTTHTSSVPDVRSDSRCSNSADTFADRFLDSGSRGDAQNSIISTLSELSEVSQTSQPCMEMTVRDTLDETLVSTSTVNSGDSRGCRNQETSIEEEHVSSVADIGDEELRAGDRTSSQAVEQADLPQDGEEPSIQERATLRRVPDTLPWVVYFLLLAEFLERFAFYGLSTIFINYIMWPLPYDAPTGAGRFHAQSGALNMGQTSAEHISLFYDIWGYVCPFLGAYVADTFWGHFRTLFYAAGITACGYTILTVSSVPGIIETSTAKYLFIVSLGVLGVGIGAFKACITPLIAAQYRRSKLSVSTTAKGERIIVDPSLSALRVYMYFYEANLLGGVAGSVGLFYAEKFVGFWLCYTIPATILFLSATGLWLGRKNYSHNPHTPPPGPVLTTFLRALCYASKGKWSLNPFRVWKSFTADGFWETAKPSNVQGTPPKWMTYDDEWIDEVRRGVKACGVFLWYPIYWTTNGQLVDNLPSQAVSMTIHGLPLDVLVNLAAIATIILIPIFDFAFYPILRLSRINFTPLKRITAGFLLGSLAMAWAAVIQHFVYKTNPSCGSDSDDSFCIPSLSGLSIWLQSGSYILIGMSQILTLVTGLEYAFTKAPRSMRALVAAVYLLMQAISTGLSQALVSLSADPLLVWNFGSIAVVALLSGALFWLSVRNLDKHEDELNNLPEGHLRARDPSRRGNGDGESSPIHKEQLEYDNPLEPVWFIMDLADL